MKITGILLLFAGLFLAAGCSTSKNESSSPSSETTVRPTDPAPTTDSPAPGAEGSGAETDLDKVSPDQVVKQLYDLHQKEKSPFFQTKNRPLLDRFFDKTLADLIWNDLNSDRDEVGVLDFDVLYNAQDAEIKKLSVGPASIEGEKAAVGVAFENYGRKENLTFSLTKRGDAWRISDIRYNGGDTLLGYFKEDAKNRETADAGEDGSFEGTYQVGETTCTVKPIKMAFELKWAKGSGTMIFFSDGGAGEKYTYHSEDKGAGVDKFVFDDAGLRTGKFIRADGKQMKVKKIG